MSVISVTGVFSRFSRCLSSTALKQVIQSLPMQTSFGKKILCGASVGSVLKVVDFAPPNLSHESMIKQACTSTINSASALLTTTVAAILDVSKTYRENLSELIHLLEQTSVSDALADEKWDSIVEARLNVSKTKSYLTELKCYMDTVEKLVHNASETAFLAGAEFICSSMLERLESAKAQIEKDLNETKKIEQEYLQIQKILAEGKYVHSKRKKSLEVK